MHVPIEVVRKGLSEKYVDLLTKENEAHQKLIDAKNRFNKISKSIYGEMSNGLCVVNSPYTCAVSLGEQNVWKHTLIIEGLSKELVNAAGEIVDANAKYHKIRIELQAMLNERKALIWRIKRK